MIVKINHTLLFPNPIAEMKEELRDWSQEAVKEMVLGGLDALRTITVEMSYSIALIGSGLCLLFWVVGWTDGKKWVGVLLLSYVLIKLLLGGV